MPDTSPGGIAPVKVAILFDDTYTPAERLMYAYFAIGEGVESTAKRAGTNDDIAHAALQKFIAAGHIRIDEAGAPEFHMGLVEVDHA